MLCIEEKYLYRKLKHRFQMFFIEKPNFNPIFETGFTMLYLEENSFNPIFGINN